MSNDGREILEALRGTRRFFEEVALLLKTAEGLMGRSGWVSHGGVATRGVSRSIDSPASWMPWDAFRFFFSEKAPSLLAFVSVIVDAPDEPHLIGEPLVSAGWYEYAKGTEPRDWTNDYASWHVHMPNHTEDGCIVSGHARELWSDDSLTFERWATLARPLVEISAEKELQTQIVAPLLGELGKAG